jgi:hypothetical protein
MHLPAETEKPKEIRRFTHLIDRPLSTIAILDFVFDHKDNDQEKFRHDIKLIDGETHRVFYVKLLFIFLEMPKFTKSEDQLQNRYEKWLFILKNLSKLDRVPDSLRERIFTKLFETAEIARFNKKELMEYHDSLKQYRDLKNSLDTPREEGIQSPGETQILI